MGILWRGLFQLADLSGGFDSPHGLQPDLLSIDSEDRFSDISFPTPPPFGRLSHERGPGGGFFASEDK